MARTFLQLSFASGIVRPMLATLETSGSFGSFDAEAVKRCENMQQTATIINAATYEIVGRVVSTNLGYAYIAEKDLPRA